MYILFFQAWNRGLPEVEIKSFTSDKINISHPEMVNLLKWKPNTDYCFQCINLEMNSESDLLFGKVRNVEFLFLFLKIIFSWILNKGKENHLCFSIRSVNDFLSPYLKFNILNVNTNNTTLSSILKYNRQNLIIKKLSTKRFQKLVKMLSEKVISENST